MWVDIRPIYAAALRGRGRLRDDSCRALRPAHELHEKEKLEETGEGWCVRTTRSDRHQDRRTRVTSGRGGHLWRVELTPPTEASRLMYGDNGMAGPRGDCTDGHQGIIPGRR